MNRSHELAEILLRNLIAITGALGLVGASGAGAEEPLTVDLGGGVSMALVRVPAGKFLMGSSTEGKYRSQRNERPQHEVSIPEDFLIGRCEVTRGQFAAFVRDADYKTEAETKGWTFTIYEEEWNYGYPQEMTHFIDCIRHDKEPMVTGRDGRVVIETLFAAYESAGTGRKVEMPFKTDAAKPIDLWRRG